MDHNEEMLELLRKIEKSNRQKTVTNILLCVFMLAAAGSCVIICVMVYQFLPRVNGLLDQLGMIMTDMEDAVRKLSALDLENMVSNANSLAVLAQDSLNQTMEKLNAIDFETLNRAIENLAKVIEPMARVAGFFGG